MKRRVVQEVMGLPYLRVSEGASCAKVICFGSAKPRHGDARTSG